MDDEPLDETIMEERGGLLVFLGRLIGELPDHRTVREERLDRVGGPARGVSPGSSIPPDSSGSD